MGVKRGDLVTVALPGSYGKPRPTLVIQSDLFDEHPSVAVLPITSDLRDTPIFRITIQPTSGNGLSAPSQVMVDKAQTIPRAKICETFGHPDSAERNAVDRALAVSLGLV
jgi:mRNA interferase MazF